jgi:hypothetical protein
LAKSRFRGRPLARRAPRMPFEKYNGTRAVARLQRVRAPKPNRGLESSFSPAFRTRMDLSACWMSQGLEFLPPPPVRASCRPDMHSSRPLPSPWSCPVHPLGQAVLKDMGARQALRTSASRSTRETIATCSVSVRDVDNDISPIVHVKNKMRTLRRYFF